ncbi:MAG TPA: hypothetical protein VFQ25_00120 [Ktedonobacterales bacterium]|nr:hypothetical protein [Ktedonobacterales bacterium]
MAELTAAEQVRDGRADFDFFMGSWNIKHHRLAERLKGCDTWEDYAGTAEARKVLGDLGNTDEITMDTPAGCVRGMTVRLFDPHTRLWRLYWASNASGIMDEPLVGRFQNGRGEFYGHEIVGGVAIFSRFIWTPMSDEQCRWEQAFSADGGRTWETNWIMEFTRRGE